MSELLERELLIKEAIQKTEQLFDVLKKFNVGSDVSEERFRREVGEYICKKYEQAFKNYTDGQTCSTT